MLTATDASACANRWGSLIFNFQSLYLVFQVFGFSFSASSPIAYHVKCQTSTENLRETGKPKEGDWQTA
eukprot:6459493-Amphidinium_carterae.1